MWGALASLPVDSPYPPLTDEGRGHDEAATSDEALTLTATRE
jgi:hypothetical protein